jgi:hypothetical protein
MRFAVSTKNLRFLVLPVLALLSAPLLAQEARGKFTLQRPVRWGEVQLAPGEYSYSVERRAAGTVLLRNAAGSMGAIVLATSISDGATPEASQLVLQQHGREWFVRSLVLGGGTDEVLNFSTPGPGSDPSGRTPRRLP